MCRYAGRQPLRIDAEHLVGDEQRIEAVGDEVDAHRGDDEPGGVDRFAAGQRDDGERDRAEQVTPAHNSFACRSIVSLRSANGAVHGHRMHTR